MGRTQLSLAGLMAIVFIIALGIVALLNATALWASVLFICTVALMSAAVEEVFRADEEEELDWSGGFGQRVALDLVGSMDVVAMVEYSMEGQRDVVRRTWYLGGMPGRAPSDPPHAE